MTDVACSRSFSASTAIGSMMASAGSSASVCGFRLTGRRGRCPHGFRAEPVEITERCSTFKQGAKDQQRVQDRMEHLEAGKEECASDCSGDLAGHGVGAVLHRLVSCADRDDISRVPATCFRESSAASARGIST